MDRRVHLLGEKVHNTEVVPLDKDMEMVYIEVVVLGMVHMVVGVVNRYWGHMEVNGGKGLVSVVIQSYVERMVSEYRVGLVGSY